eukprot:CAMPEP_0185734272 /NCGR_PEP_ID=MMETSP1171-20130828/21973_1 /TAXON_ID=374046 /ORGANISM="Helicotheca tamensis, Strain CCMP826" /LENGTH=253 /DNA_ID=CAMNT_0028404229 /DNA_START=32 /DNA_END=790 /DNA_ORIENTATION=-
MLLLFVVSITLFGLNCHISLASFGVFHLPRHHHHQKQQPLSLLWAQENNDNKENNKPPKKSGYKFGDITRSIGRKLTKNENYQFGDITKSVSQKLTGKEDYQFGDISRWLDSQAKNAVNQATGKDQYEFGDLTKYLDAIAKEKVSNFTQKEEYVVGDISKEVVRRAWSGEYEMKDMLLLLRVLASFGVATFAPVAQILPVKMLLSGYNTALEFEVAGRVTEFLAEAIDRRFKEAITGDENYQLGDVTKKKIMG